MTRHDIADAVRDDRPAQIADSLSGLAPTVRTVASASLPRWDRSLPVALCTAAGTVGFEAVDRDDPTRPGPTSVEHLLEPVAGATALLEGYVRLRLALVVGDDDSDTDTGVRDGSTALAASRSDWLPPLLERIQSPTDRDTAILASDHLHASAYTMIADAPVSDRTRLDLYRALTSGSTALARGCLRGDGDGGGVGDIDVDGDRSSSSPKQRGESRTPDVIGVEATLAKTAGRLGAAVVGAPAETRTALGTYSHALMSALASRTAVDTAVNHRSDAVEALVGESTRESGAANRETADVEIDSRVERHLERARDAIASLADAIGTDAPAAEERATDPAPLERLERATRLSGGRRG